MVTFIPFFLCPFLHPMPYSIPSFLNVAVFYYNNFTKVYTNQQLASGWLMHSIHSSNAVFLSTRDFNRLYVVI
jgi:hypothetical protein